MALNPQNQLYLQAPHHQVYQSCQHVLQQLGYQVVEVNDDTFVIRAERGTSWRSWGEVVTLTIEPVSPGQTRVTIQSDSKVSLTIIDWGKNAENVARIRSALLLLYRELKADDEDAERVSVSTGRKRVPVPESDAGTRASPRTVILFLAAQPDDRAFVRLDIEARQIGERLNEGNVRDQFELEKEFAVRATDLSRALLTHRPGIVHFSGHGEKAGIVLTNNDNTSRLVSGAILANLFRIVHQKYPMDCVLLNCCWSDEQAHALKAIGIPYVIGTDTLIPDATAQAFAAGFYRGLGFGLDIPAAFELGKNETLLENEAREWALHFHLL